MERVGTVNLVEPVPVETVELEEPVETVESMSVELVELVEPEGSVEPLKPVELVKLFDPVEHLETVDPVVPVVPMKPRMPVQPIEPRKPRNSAEPWCMLSEHVQHYFVCMFQVSFVSCSFWCVHARFIGNALKTTSVRQNSWQQAGFPFMQHETDLYVVPGLISM